MTTDWIRRQVDDVALVVTGAVVPAVTATAISLIAGMGVYDNAASTKCSRSREGGSGQWQTNVIAGCLYVYLILWVVLITPIVANKQLVIPHPL